MEVYRRSSWLLLLLGLSLLATALQGVQGEVESEGPTESECRPYIEKALKELEAGETEDAAPPEDGDSKEDLPTVEITTDDSDHPEGDGDDDADGDGKDSTESAETEKTDDVEATEGDGDDDDNDDDDDDDNKPDDDHEDDDDDDESGEKNKSPEDASHEEEASQEHVAEEAEQEESKEDENKSEENDNENEEEQEQHDEPAAADTTDSTEDTVDSKENDDDDDNKEGDSKEDKEDSKEDDKDDSKEDDGVASKEEEGADSKEDDDGVDNKEDDDENSKEGEASKEDEAEGSKEGDDSKEDGVQASNEDEAGDSKEDDGVASKEDDDGDSKEDDQKDSKEDDEDSKEDAGTDSKEDAATDSKEDDGKDSKEDDGKDSKEDDGKDSKEDDDDSKEGDKADSKEDDDSKEDVKVLDAAVEVLDSKEDDSKEDAKDDSKEDDAASKEDDKDDSKEDSKEAASKEKDDGDDDSDDDDDDDDDGEAVAEVEELLKESEEDLFDLRPREHIAQLLKLDEDSSDAEKVSDKMSEIILKDLKKLYENAIKPLETLYKYRDLSNRHFGDAEIFSKPLILFMGPWSGGKSSIINYLVDIEHNETNLHTGAEPSPAYFNILMYGEEPEVLDGTELAADYTFSGLQKFGQGLEERLRGYKLPSKLLEKVNIVEIPGILEVRKQVSRVFPFNDACQWFIDRADIIFLVYDPSKLDVGPETEAILDQLKGREQQTRIVLNKADQVKPEELMRVQGALIWNISPLMSSAQPPVMYTTSLWSKPYEPWAPVRLLQAQERAFLRDLRSAVDKRIDNKIASARRFAVRVRNHAKMVDCYLTTYYNHKSVFGNRKQISDEIINHPQDYHIYEGLSTLTNISRYDLPDPDVYRDFFRLNALYDFQQLSATCTYFRGCPINRLDVAIAYDLPELVGKHKRLVETAANEAPTTAPTPGS